MVVGLIQLVPGGGDLTRVQLYQDSGLASFSLNQATHPTWPHPTPGKTQHIIFSLKLFCTKSLRGIIAKHPTWYFYSWNYKYPSFQIRISLISNKILLSTQNQYLTFSLCVSEITVGTLFHKTIVSVGAIPLKIRLNL